MAPDIADFLRDRGLAILVGMIRRIGTGKKERKKKEMDENGEMNGRCLDVWSVSPCNSCGVANYASLSETDIMVLAHLHNVDTREQLV